MGMRAKSISGVKKRQAVKAVFEEPPEDGEDADEDANEDEDKEG